MSGIRSLWSSGQALVIDDMANFAGNAATEDDRVYEALLASPSAKKVLLLGDESASTNPRLLAVATSGNAGVLSIQPALYVVSTGSDQTVKLASALYSNGANPPSGVFGALNSPSIGANSSGAARYDLIYATLARSVVSSASRKVKDPVAGTISTQTLNVLDQPLVTLAVVSSTVSVSDAISKLPADSSTAWNFAVAVVTVANGYTAGTAIAQSAVTQAWAGGFLRPQQIRGARPMSIFTSGANESPTTGALGKVQSDRWGSDERWLGAFKLLTTTSITNGIVLDSTIDWRNRFLYGFIARPASNAGVYAPAESVTVPGATNAVTIGPCFTGTTGATAASWSSPGAAACTFALSANSSTGALTLIPSAANPSDATNGDNYLIWVVASDRFAF